MISDDAYNLLKKRKRENESFSDVIKRLASEKGTVRNLIDLVNSENFSSISDETAKNIGRTSKEMRQNFKLRDVEL